MSFIITKIYILAATQVEAERFARSIGLPKYVWVYIDREERMQGVTRFLVFVLDSVKEHPRYQQIRRALGMYKDQRRAEICMVSSERPRQPANQPDMDWPTEPENLANQRMPDSAAHAAGDESSPGTQAPQR